MIVETKETVTNLLRRGSKNITNLANLITLQEIKKEQSDEES
jgi:hypothetical protein